MASAPLFRRLPSRQQLGHWGEVAVIALVTGLCAAYFTYLFTAKLNTESANQQQNLAAVQEFNSSGAKVDAAITDLADDVIDKEDVKQTRKEVRQAIAAHVAATQALAPVMGTGNVEEYMRGLATLRRLVDQTGDAGAALRTSHARFDLMENRQTMLAEARRRIYGKP